MMMDIDAVAVKIHQTARDHGFWDGERNLGEMLMLVTSELAECLEENRAHKPRVYWKCKDCGYETDDIMVSRNSRLNGHYIPTRNTIFAGILRMLGLSSTTVLCESRGPLKPEGELVEVADAIIRLLDTGHDMASKTRFTISDVIDMKMRYNEQREHMHGKAY